jgi:hypothetical protein
VRTLQDLAVRGLIAGAAKIGCRWTFDPEKLRQQVKQKEREVWASGKRPQDVFGAAVPFGAGRKFGAGTSDGRYTQVTRRLRGRVIKRDMSG